MLAFKYFINADCFISAMAIYFGNVTGVNKILKKLTYRLLYRKVYRGDYNF
jgi:hypothetical protein